MIGSWFVGGIKCALVIVAIAALISLSSPLGWVCNSFGLWEELFQMLKLIFGDYDES